MGKGELVRIWKDPWVPGYNILQHETHGNGISVADEVETVATLVDFSIRSWKVQSVQVLFNPSVADNILKLRLSTFQSSDKWIWGVDSNGRFTVRSVTS